MIRSPCRPCRHRPAASAGAFFSGFSATIASVVTSRPATEAASCSAVRTTLVGSMMPAFTRSLNSPVCASKPQLYSSLSSDLAGDHRTVLAGVLGDLAQRGLDRLAHDLDAEALVVVVGLQLGQDQRRRAPGRRRRPERCLPRPPRGSRAGCRRRGPCAPSPRPRCEPPTRITATPPASFASRSCSFSRS